MVQYARAAARRLSAPSQPTQWRVKEPIKRTQGSTACSACQQDENDVTEKSSVLEHTIEREAVNGAAAPK